MTLSHLIKSKLFIQIKLLTLKNFIDSSSISNVMIKIDSELYRIPFIKILFLKNKKLCQFSRKHSSNSMPGNSHILTSKSEKNSILKSLIGKIFISIMTAPLKETFFNCLPLKNQLSNNKLNLYQEKILPKLLKLYTNNNSKNQKNDSSLIISSNFIHLFQFFHYLELKNDNIESHKLKK